MGLKAVAVYRDGSKGVQPLSAREKTSAKAPETRADQPAPSQSRRRLPETRRSITHKFGIGAMECYVTVGLYEDGRPGEIFINPGKQGSTLSGILDSFAMTFSVAMQYGAPLEVMVEKLAHQQYEPSGITTSKDPDLMFAASISDYLAKWLRKTFLEPQLSLEFAKVPGPSTVPEPEKSRQGFTGRACANCGSMMVQAGKCHACPRCGSSSGCS
jgi:ribonucleoside-diphosphate reductase alpha chain